MPSSELVADKDQAELNKILEESKELEMPLITSEEALHKIVTAKNSNELDSRWRSLIYEGLLSQDLNPAMARKFFLALINAAFRCGDIEECFRYYGEVQNCGLVDQVILRTMLRISASDYDITNLNQFYSILKDSNQVEPMDHYLVMRTLKRCGDIKRAGEISHEYMTSLRAATQIMHNSFFNRSAMQKSEENVVVKAPSVTATIAPGKT